MSSTINALTSGGGLAMAGDTSGQLQLLTNNGTAAVTVDTSQNVGIGTASPTTRLDVRSSQPTINAQATTNGNAGLLQLTALSSDGSNTCAVQMIGASIGNNSASNMIFKNDSGGGLIERMRINSSGQVLVGQTSGSGANEIFGAGTSASATAACFQSTNTGQANDIALIRANRNTTNGSFKALTYYNDAAGAYRFIVADSGNVTNTNGSYGTISDVRLKENIVDATSKLDKVNQLKVRNFNLIGDNLKQIGFVAQEFEDVFPSMVEESQDKTPDGEVLETTTKTIKTTVLIPILVKAIQELNAKVDAQALEIQALKGVA